MKKALRIIIPIALYFIIPALCIACFLLFEAAQGEKLEEILGGLLIGIALDFIYSLILLLIHIINLIKDSRK
ncbi:MAG: hypothetical protein IJA52_06250 [Clostridia bacterium]|nr:hypothetical protein [Clostridia bacterium]